MFIGKSTCTIFLQQKGRYEVCKSLRHLILRNEIKVTQRQPVKESNWCALSLLVACKQNSCTLVGSRAGSLCLRLTSFLFAFFLWRENDCYTGQQKNIVLCQTLSTSVHALYMPLLGVNQILYEAASKTLSISRLLHRSFELYTLDCFPQEKVELLVQDEGGSGVL